MTLQTKSAPPAQGAEMLPARAAEAAARIAELRAEAEATLDRSSRAALLYEAAFLCETALHQPAQAVNDYLAAYNVENRFRLPLHALIRLFERKRSFKNLARLYESEQRTAHTAEEKTVALLDQAVLALAAQGEPETVRPRLMRALESDEGTEAALLLEWRSRIEGDPEGALAALQKRARNSDDPLHAGTLAIELAHHLEARGDLGGALEALKGAALGSVAYEPFLVALARFARAHGFVPELVEACERRAELAVAELRRTERSDAPDLALQESLRSRAVALWYEAARLRCTSLGDPDEALTCISRALDLRPDDLLLRQTRMLAFDLMEDRARAADEARAIIAQGVDGEHAAALHFRLAEHALVTGDLTAARESLMEAIAHAGGSVAADAILDDLLLDEGLHRERIERREARAATANAVRASRFLFEAAHIAAWGAGDAERARELYRAAALKGEAPSELTREAYGAALDLGDPELARFALDKLLARPLEEDERAACLHHRLEISVSKDEARELLNQHLEDDAARSYWPQLARVRAAEQRDFDLLARVHARLGAQSIEGERATAHLCAAARAHVRAGELEKARALLDRVLARDPSHRYALALAQHVLRGLGQAQEIVTLLRRAAEAQSGDPDAELSLLLAGAAAEAAGDLERAVENYRQAAQRHDSAWSPVWALLRLGQRRNDAALVREAREQLAARERATSQESFESLLLAEALELSEEDPRRARELLTPVLRDPVAGHHAAAALASAHEVSTEEREHAIEELAERVDDQNRPPLLRELGGMLLAQGAEQARVVEVVERLSSLAPDDPWALWTRASIPLPHDEEGHADALIKLAEATSDSALAQAARAEALLVRALAHPGESLSSLMGEASEPSDELLALALAFGSPRDDAALRGLALARLEATAEGGSHHGRLALARAQLSAGQADAAVATLDGILAHDADCVEAWELMRVAARRAGQFARVAQAAEALAARLEGELCIQLLEESAVVRMDELSDLRGTERVLGEILAREPDRKLAYGRMHDLLSARGDTDKLSELVRTRTELVDDAEELVGLFFELARLHRASGDLDAALDAVDNVLMLEEHVGALALAAEIHTTRENWAEAVEALRGLAAAPFVPDAQRRLARIGAADFLEHRLQDGAGALRELEQAAATGKPDAALYTRIADVAERLGDLERAVSALRAAIDATEGAHSFPLRLRCAALLADKAGAIQDAIELVGSVVQAQPGNAEAVRALHALFSDSASRAALLTKFESVVRSELADAPLDPEPWRKLLLLGELRKDDNTRFIALSGLVALSHNNAPERELYNQLTPGSALPTTALGRGDLASLCTLQVDYAELLTAVFGCAVDIDHLDPARFGVGRGQRVTPRDAHALRDEIARLARAFGQEILEFYVGGDDPGRILAIPREDGLVLIVGAAISAPLSVQQRAQVAVQLAAAHLASVPLLTRTPAQAARLLYAAMAAADCPLPANVLKQELGDLPRNLSKALPRKIRKALPDLVRKLPDQGYAAEQHCHATLRATRRLALLVCGDLAPVLEHLLGAFPTREGIAASEDALDLLKGWGSHDMDSLRSKLGFAR